MVNSSHILESVFQRSLALLYVLAVAAFFGAPAQSEGKGLSSSGQQLTEWVGVAQDEAAAPLEINISEEPGPLFTPPPSKDRPRRIAYGLSAVDQRCRLKLKRAEQVFLSIKPLLAPSRRLLRFPHPGKGDVPPLG